MRAENLMHRGERRAAWLNWPESSAETCAHDTSSAAGELGALSPSYVVPMAAVRGSPQP